MRDKEKLKSSMSITLLTRAENLRREKVESSKPSSKNLSQSETKRRGRPRKLEVLRKKMRPGRPPKE